MRPVRLLVRSTVFEFVGCWTVGDFGFSRWRNELVFRRGSPK